MENGRNYGILLPISALPSNEGIGTLGKGAYGFIDYLNAAGGSVWQVLPLNPTNYGDSPYQSCSSDALNYYFIDLETLVLEGLLKREEVAAAGFTQGRKVDYGKQFTKKTELLKKAYSRFKGGREFELFLQKKEYLDFATFMAIKAEFNHVSWIEWQPPYKNYDEKTVESFINDNREEVDFWQFTQFIFLKQWNALKEYANKKGVKIMGDIPLYIAYDSVEVWKYGNKLFKMDEERNPEYIAGCPPDGFTQDGQLWGNPVYDWEKMKADGYVWWKKRIANCFKLFDILRIDHFRGFDRFWQVPPHDDTARGGVWCDGPKEELFAGMRGNIVAEDLGTIDEGVHRLMRNVGYPGMKVLEFAFDGRGDNEHKPSNYTENFVCYTGTHDNMPIRQYFDDLSEDEKRIYIADLIEECAKLGVACDLTDSVSVCRTIIKLAFASVAETVIIPLWDLLALGGEARMNLPSTVSDKNWSYRFVAEDFTKELLEFLKSVSYDFERI